MKRTFSDGTAVLRFTPQQFIRRIALLIPAPRQHEITYLGLLAANAKYRADIVRVPTHRVKPRVAGAKAVGESANHTKSPELRSTMSWAELLRRTFAVDVLHCTRCGGRARVIAAITEPKLINKILAHLFNQNDGAPASARGPPHHPCHPPHLTP